MTVFWYSISDSLSALLLNLGTLSFIEFKFGNKKKKDEFFGEHVSEFEVLKVLSYPELTKGLSKSIIL